MAGLSSAQKNQLKPTKQAIATSIAQGGEAPELQDISQIKRAGRPFDLAGPLVAVPIDEYVSPKGNALFCVGNAAGKGIDIWVNVKAIWPEFDPENNVLDEFYAHSMRVAPSKKGDAFFMRKVELA